MPNNNDYFLTLQDRKISEQAKEIRELKAQIHEKDIHIRNLETLAQSLRYKNRFKRFLKHFIPNTIWTLAVYIKNHPYLIKKAWTVFRQHGFIYMLKKMREKSTGIIQNTTAYLYREPVLNEAIKQEIDCFVQKPLISIIMPVYNVDPKWLDLAIQSIKKQWYDNWELCIVDDASTNEETIKFLQSIENEKIKVQYLKTNQNISGASNEALNMARGEYIALMDNDDEITPNALYEVVKAINEGAEFIYSDEDKIELDGTYTDPHFKPDYAPDMFLSTNYLSHLGVIKKTLIDKVNGFTIGLEGSQDYDLYLKVLEHTTKIKHVTKVLYHWRKIPGSTAVEYGEKSYASDAGKKALENALARRGIDAIVLNGIAPGHYRIKYNIQGNPLISIVIPFKDKPDLLVQCVNSILAKSTYTNFEIIGISNNSQNPDTFKAMESLKKLDERVKFYEYNEPFNYSAINNYAVNYHVNGEHTVLLNNDIEIISPDWIESLLEYSQREDVGAVGAKLIYADHTIQHAGIIYGIFNNVAHIFHRFPKDAYGYFTRLQIPNNYLAVTAACLMVKTSLYKKLNGLNEKNLAVAYNDVDFCLRLYEQGYLNVYTPYCEAYHFESISRGNDESVEKLERLGCEFNYLLKRHQAIFEQGDPYYNPNLSDESARCDIARKNTVAYRDVQFFPFEETIIFTNTLKEQEKDTLCFFSHFDKCNTIDDYVVYYLEELSKYSDIVFISTADQMEEQETKKIETLCKKIIIKKNTGYDFGSWKTGLNSESDELHKYERLLCCNDSVYGPFDKLEYFFNEMDKSAYDVFSITDSHEYTYHLQSFFVAYSKKAFMSSIFKYFWDSYEITPHKQQLINKYELRLAKIFIDNGFKVGALCSSVNKSMLNMCHFYWQDLIEKQHCPFIKIELLKDNPRNVNILSWKKVLKSKNFNTDLIEKHLQKIREC